MTKQSQSTNKIDILTLLREEKTIEIPLQGDSMYPFLRPLKDHVILSPIGNRQLKVNDVCLYRRNDGVLICHRICEINKNGIYTVGDHQDVIDGPFKSDVFYGIMTGYLRNGKKHSCQEWHYRVLSSIWLLLLGKRLFLLRNRSRVLAFFATIQNHAKIKK